DQRHQCGASTLCSADRPGRRAIVISGRWPFTLPRPTSSSTLSKVSRCRIDKVRDKVLDKVLQPATEMTTQLPANPFKQALREGRPQIGLWCSLCSNVAAEVIAASGFDWILTDTEHAPNELP